MIKKTGGTLTCPGLKEWNLLGNLTGALLFNHDFNMSGRDLKWVSQCQIQCVLYCL